MWRLTRFACEWVDGSVVFPISQLYCSSWHILNADFRELWRVSPTKQPNLKPTELFVANRTLNEYNYTFTAHYVHSVRTSYPHHSIITKIYIIFNKLHGSCWLKSVWMWVEAFFRNLFSPHTVRSDCYCGLNHLVHCTWHMFRAHKCVSALPGCLQDGIRKAETGECMFIG